MTFEELLRQHGVPCKPGRPGWLDLTCPFCHRPYLGYGIRYGSFSCWKCGRLDPAKTLAALLGVTPAAAVAVARGLRADRGPLPAVLKPAGKYAPPVCRGTLLEPHIRYLNSRGFNHKTLEKLWRIQGIGMSVRLQWRIFIPIHYHGRAVSWTTRAIADNVRLRYISAGAEEEAVPHKSILFGEDYCRHAIIVCEGAFDVFRIGPGAVATMGVGYTAPQLAAIARYPVRAVCFDSEPGAQRRARALMDDLTAFPGCVCNIVLDAKDPAAASKKDIATIRKEFLE